MIKNWRDFLAGWLCLLLGSAYLWAASLHAVGSAMEMGSGFLPMVLSIVLMALGGWLVFKSLTIENEGGGAIGYWAWRPLLLVLGCLVLMGALLPAR